MVFDASGQVVRQQPGGLLRLPPVGGLPRAAQITDTSDPYFVPVYWGHGQLPNSVAVDVSEDEHLYDLTGHDGSYVPPSGWPQKGMVLRIPKVVLWFPGIARAMSQFSTSMFDSVNFPYISGSGKLQYRKPAWVACMAAVQSELDANYIPKVSIIDVLQFSNPDWQVVIDPESPLRMCLDGRHWLRNVTPRRDHIEAGFFGTDVLAILPWCTNIIGGIEAALDANEAYAWHQKGEHPARNLEMYAADYALAAQAYPHFTRFAGWLYLDEGPTDYVPNGTIMRQTVLTDWDRYNQIPSPRFFNGISVITELWAIDLHGDLVMTGHGTVDYASYAEFRLDYDGTNLPFSVHTSTPYNFARELTGDIALFPNKQGIGPTASGSATYTIKASAINTGAGTHKPSTWTLQLVKTTTYDNSPAVFYLNPEDTPFHGDISAYHAWAEASHLVPMCTGTGAFAGIGLDTLGWEYKGRVNWQSNATASFWVAKIVQHFGLARK